MRTHIDINYGYSISITRKKNVKTMATFDVGWFDKIKILRIMNGKKKNSVVSFNLEKKK